MTLLFKKPMLPKIHDGTKTATRRPLRPMVKEGGRYHLKTELFKAHPDSIQVDRLYQEPLGARARRSGPPSSKHTTPNKPSGSSNSGTWDPFRPYN